MIRSNIISSILVVGLLTTIMTTLGCSKPLPKIIPVSGKLQLDGKPLPNVEVKFIPMAEGLDGNFIGSGVTDDNGNYTLRLPGKEESGCPACECKITINEGPMPEGIRGGENEQVAATKFLKSLKNRPIPEKFQRMADTPLSVTVSEDESNYDMDLNR